MQDNPGRTRPTASVITLGCKVNQYESAFLGRRLEAAGYELVAKGEPADLTVINSCTVTHRADEEVRNLARRAWRANPGGWTVITGCYVHYQAEKLAALPGVALILGNSEKSRLLELLGETPPEHRPRIIVSPPGRDPLPDLGAPDFDRTRAFFRIQDGCSAACAYCAIPRARGPSRSLPEEQVLAGLEEYSRHGYAEVVLTGIHIGAWGLDLQPPGDFTALVVRLAAQPGPRLRISSIEPNEVTPRLAGLVRDGGRVCPHLHLALQSGSENVLRIMGRPYSAAFFRELVAELVRDHPEICLGADVLVGHPGETEEDFARTRDLLAELPLAYFHCFSYSRRPRTRAAVMPGQVPPDEIKRRVGLLREIGQDKRRAFLTTSLGSTRPALIENSRDHKTGLVRGLTDNYIQVLIPDPAPEPNTIVPVLLQELTPGLQVFARPA